MGHPTPSGRYHAVQFYGTDDQLFSTAATFLAEGLIVGEPALIIASAAHREGMLGQLNARLIDVNRARKRGDLLVLDADEMLALFMVDGVPDPGLFDTNIGRFIEQVLQGRPGSILRAYGGMVDILCKLGQTDAAIRLEILWNTIATRFGLALLCGYAMGSFFKQVAQLQDICSHHTHIFGPEHASPFHNPVTH
jgi:MEDS: MEthanogen/methylotroph, DcmR Sensory domain